MPVEQGGTGEVRFYGALRDFLPPSQRAATSLPVSLPERPGVKHVLEALGVPHPEIELLLVDGAPSPLTARVAPGARIAAYPRFHGVAPDPDLLATPRPEPPVRFALDGHLGGLARFLRLLGFDASWQPQIDDADLAAQAVREDRVLLTRDVGCLMRSAVVQGHWLRSTAPERQLLEILEHFELGASLRPFTRCLVCNVVLLARRAAEVRSLVPPRVAERHRLYRQCPQCLRIYWRGTHALSLTCRMERVLAQLSPEAAGRAVEDRGPRAPW